MWLTAAGAPYYDDIDPVRTALAVLLGTGGLIGMYFLDCAVLVRRAGAVYLLALAAGIFSLIHSPNISNVSYYTRYVVLCYRWCMSCGCAAAGAVEREGCFWHWQVEFLWPWFAYWHPLLRDCCCCF